MRACSAGSHPRIAAFVGVAPSSSSCVAVLAKAWYDSRLPGTYSVMAYGDADYGGGSVPAGSLRAHRAYGGTASASPIFTGRRAGRPDARFELTAKAATIRLASGRADRRADVQRVVSRPRAPREAGRPRRGDPPQRGRRPGRDDPLARRRRPERRGRRRRRHPERRPARRALHVPLPRRAGRNVLVPHATRSPRRRSGAGSSARSSSSRAPVRRRRLDLALVAHTFDGIPTLNG